jgi:hypothetical protein
MEMVEELFTGLMELWRAMFEAFMEIAPKVLSLVIWVLLAIVILPCVFVAGNIYPWWSEWGEKL